MLRRFLVLAGALVLAVPMVLSQNVTVCVFQAQKGHKMPDGSDAQELARALTGLKLPNGSALNAVPFNGVAEKNEDAAAQKQSCAFIAEVWRNDLPQNSPLFAGTLHPGSNTDQDSLDNANQMNRDSTENTVVEYTLRKADSDKKFAHGESDNNKPSSLADTMAKKIAKAK